MLTEIITLELKDNKKTRFFIYLENQLIGYSFLSQFSRENKSACLHIWNSDWR